MGKIIKINQIFTNKKTGQFSLVLPKKEIMRKKIDLLNSRVEVRFH